MSMNGIFDWINTQEDPTARLRQATTGVSGVKLGEASLGIQANRLASSFYPKVQEASASSPGTATGTPGKSKWKGYYDLRPALQKAAAAAGVPASWVDSPAFIELIGRESGWNQNAKNPTSTAYGLFQFLDSTRKNYGIPKNNDPYTQAVAGFKYIKDRYGTPEAALKFHDSKNWY